MNVINFEIWDEEEFDDELKFSVGDVVICETKFHYLYPLLDSTIVKHLTGYTYRIVGSTIQKIIQRENGENIMRLGYDSRWYICNEWTRVKSFSESFDDLYKDDNYDNY